jgi:hypothetical protein
MITVATFDNQADAHIAKGRLEAEGLSPVLGDSHLVQTDWLYSAALGGIKLQVPAAEAERARQLLAQDRSDVLSDWSDEATETAGVGGSDAANGPAATDRWAALAHMAALAGAIVPFGHLLGPLLVWLWRRNESAATDAAGREAINFQISVTLYAGVLTVLVPDTAELAALVALFGLDMTLVLLAAARTRRGLPFRYPLTLRVLL